MPTFLRGVVVCACVALVRAGCTSVPAQDPNPTNATVLVCVPVWAAPRTPPSAGTPVEITFVPEPRQALTAAILYVNNVSVLETWASAGDDGNYTTSYNTTAQHVLWPWEGLHIQGSFQGGNLSFVFQVDVVPGVALVDEAAARGMADFGDASVCGICVGDVDGDNDVDVFVGMTNGLHHQLWINNGTGTFTDQAAAWGTNVRAKDQAFGCGFADVTGTGTLDLMVSLKSSRANQLFINDGARLQEDGAKRGANLTVDSGGVSLGDVDGDGDIDALVTTDASQNVLLLNDGSGVFAAAAVGPVVDSTQAVLVDIDDDGDLDGVVANNGLDQVLVNTGGSFMDDGALRGFTDDAASLGLVVGDWNGDGSVDVFIVRSTLGDAVYLNDGHGFFRLVDLMPAQTGGAAATVADLELDGDVDIGCPRPGGRDVVFLNHGGGGFVSDPSLLWERSYGVAVGDIDGDGDLEVLLGYSRRVLVNHNARPGVRSAIVIRPLTANGAQSAFGATVRLECVEGCGGGAWVGVRVIDGGSGLYSQNAYDAHFGVPHTAASYNGSVRWSGDVHVVSTWATHRRLGGMRGSAAAVVVRPEGLQVWLGVVSPWDAGLDVVEGWEVVVPVVLQPGHNAGDLRVNVSVNGVDVSGTWGWLGNGTYGVRYVPARGEEEWPWRGLEVAVVGEDGGGLEVVVSGRVVPGSTWSEEGAARGLPGVGNFDRGTCMGDVDADGDVDAVILGVGDTALLLNNGAGVLTDATTTWSPSGLGADCFSCAFADADGDGLLDLFITRFNDDVSELHMNRGGMFVEEGLVRGVRQGSSSLGASWGDVDGDGDVDLFVCNWDSTPDSVFINDGRGNFTDEAAHRAAPPPSSSRQPVLADLDGDSDLDVVVVSNTHEVFINNGTGWFGEESDARGFSPGPGPLGLGVADWSGDGVVDIVVTVVSRDVLLLNDGFGVFSDTSAEFGLVNPSGTYRGFTSLDLEHDGDMDVFVGKHGGGASVWVFDGNRNVFNDQAGLLGLGAPANAFSAVAGDIDGDGDLDVMIAKVGHLHVNHNARPGFSSAIVIRPLTADGAQSAFGATVRLECVEGCGGGAWVGVRVIDGGSGLNSQNAYDAHFGVPHTAASYTACVVFAGGATQDNATDPSLGGLVSSPPRVHVVVNRPYLAALSASYTPHTVILPANATVDVVLSAGLGRSDLVPAPGCCFVNGVQVRGSFQNAGGGAYMLSYVPRPGDSGWAPGNLTVLAPLQSTSRNLSSIPVTYTLKTAPGGDPAPPRLSFTCQPGPVTPNVVESVCVDCGPETECVFSYAVSVDRLAASNTSTVPASAMASPTSAGITVGPFQDRDAVTVVVTAADPAGNTATATVTWLVDTTAPKTSFDTFPPALTSRSDASFTLSCSEPACTYVYALNGGPLTPLGSNSTASNSTASLTVDTLLSVAPERRSNATAPAVAFAVDTAGSNASVQVTLGTESWHLPLNSTNATDVLQLPPLPDGSHVLSALATVGGVRDASPLEFEFRVDTVPPALTLLHAPRDGSVPLAPTVVVAASEPDCTFLWRAARMADVGMEPWEASPSGVFHVAAVSHGVPHAVHVKAVDPAGNTGPLLSTTWTPAACPATPPDVVITSSVGVGAGDRFVAFATADGTLWPEFEFSVHGGPWLRTDQQALTLEGQPLGVPVTLAIRAAVPAGCPVAPTTTTSWQDEAPPPVAVSVVEQPPGSTADVFAVFEFSASRREAWLQYRLDDAPRWTPCTTHLRVGALQPGRHTLEVRAVNSAGDPAGDPTSVVWTILSDSASSIALRNLPDGVHTLTVIATDVAGLDELAPRTYTWHVDTVPPVVVAELESPEVSSARTAVIAVSCPGEAGGCSFCWESVSFAGNCSSNSTLFFMAEGDGVFAVSLSANDAAGLPSEERVVLVWEVDTQPPSTQWADVTGTLLPAPPSLASVADVLSASPTLHLNVTATEPVSRLWVAVGNTTAQFPGGGRLSTVVQVAAGQDGVASVAVATEDVAGNVDPNPVSLRVLVDTAPPETHVVSLPPSPTRQSPLLVGVTASDGDGSGAAGVEVGVERQGGGLKAVVPLPGPAGTASFANMTSGTYMVSATGVDAVGNVDPTPYTQLVVVDMDPPAAAFVTPNTSAVVATPNISLTLSVQEPATVFARLPGGAWVPGTMSSPVEGVVTLAHTPDGAHLVEVHAVDVAGNLQSEPFPSLLITVDTTPPVLSWVQAPPAPFTALPGFGACFSVEDTTPVAVAATPLFVTVTDHCVNFTAIGDGRVIVAVAATDAGGNAATPLIADWVLDRTPPSTVVVANVSSSGDGCSLVAGTTVCSALSAAAVTLACSDSGSVSLDVAPCRAQYTVQTLEVASDAGCARAASRRLATPSDAVVGGPTALPVAVDGWYAVVARAVDAAGNVEVGNATLEWHVDTTPPVNAPELVQQPAKLDASTTALFRVQLTGDASPGQTSFVYALDDGAATAAENLPSPNSGVVQVEVSGLAVGAHKLELWAEDQAGNPSPTVVYTWDVVNAAPEVVIVSVPAAVSGDATPSFTLAATWPATSQRSGVEPEAAVEVSLGDGFSMACAHTRNTGGRCTWNASLSAQGPGTYTLTSRAALAGAVGDPVTHTWVYRLCSDTEVATIDDSLGITCEACPVGANCVGGLTQRSSLVAQPGFWAPPASSGTFYECPVEEACLPGGDVVVGNSTQRLVSRCGEGYTGTLCAVCEDGFFEQFGACVSCGTDSGVAWLITSAVVCALVAVGVLFFKFREVMPVDQVKIVLSFTQIIASANTAYDIPWPPLFAGALNTMRVFLIEAVSLTRTSCATPLTFYSSLVITLVGFKVITIAVVVLPVGIHKCKTRNAPRAAPAPGTSRSRRRSSFMQAVRAAAVAAQAVDWAKIFKITFLFLFVAYPGVSLKIMQTFKCVEVEGESWLVADMRLKCHEGEWFGYALYAFVMGCLYTAGLPLAITVILWRNRRRLGEEGVVRRWGFLYETYGVGAYLWEVVELLRKLWLSALVVLMEAGSPLQVTVAVLISGWAHVLHAVYKPWRGVTPADSAYTYLLQHGSLGVTAFVFLMGLLFKVEGVSQGGDMYNFLAWAMLLACVVFLVVSSALLVFSSLAKLRARRVGSATGAAPKFVATPGVQAWRSQAARDVPAGPPPMLARRPSMEWRANPLRRQKAAPGAKGAPRSGDALQAVIE